LFPRVPRTQRGLVVEVDRRGYFEGQFRLDYREYLCWRFRRSPKGI